jgi:iron(III) transport system substrate-binding protein
MLAAGATVGPALAQGDDWAKVVEAARKEGKLVIYTASIGSPFHKTVINAFEQKYGIQVELLEARASEVRERVRVEQSAGRFLGDIHHNGSTTTWLMTRDGNFQPHGPIPNIKNIVPPYDADDIRVPAEVISYCLMVNRNLVKPADEPKSWKDILDPRWAGKILSDDYRALGGGAVFFVVMYDTFGKEFVEKLAAQKPVFSRDIQNSERRVARGEFPLYIPFSLQDYNNLKGLPVKPIVPIEGRPYVRFDLTVLKERAPSQCSPAVHQPLSRVRLADRVRQRRLQSGGQGRGREDRRGDPPPARDQGAGHHRARAPGCDARTGQADLQVTGHHACRPSPCTPSDGTSPR